MTDSLHLTAFIPGATSRLIFEAWLDSQKHAAFTGDTAEIQPRIGGEFTISGGYITGKTLELEPYHRIVQSWRTTEFPDGAPDSLLEVLLTDSPEGCHLTLYQKNLPIDQVDSYKKGWEDYYFHPLLKYFSLKL
jgi:activator of HSP90 ATPase